LIGDGAFAVPAAFVGYSTKVVTGEPDEKHISTSFAERNNLTMRMHMRGSPG
jgi:hypothetical protein